MKKITFSFLCILFLFVFAPELCSQYNNDEYGSQNTNRILTGLGLSASYTGIPNQAAFNQADNGSIEMWIYPTSLSTNPKTIISKGATADVSFSLSISNTDGRLVFRIGNINFANTTGGVIPINTWTHVAVTWTGGPNYTIKFYINGAQSGTDLAASATWNINTDEIRIGGSQANLSAFFQGNIDEVRFWSIDIPGSRIAKNRFVGLGDWPGANTSGAITGGDNYIGLVSSWTFNQSGTTCFDYISGYNGTYFGSAATTAISTNAPIPYNFALKLNGGITDNVRIPHHTIFNQTSHGTLDLWFKPVTFANEQVLVSKGAVPSSLTFILGVTATTGRLYFGSGTNIAINTSGVALTLNQWNHVAAAWIQVGSNMEIRFYKNGKLSGSPSVIPYSFPANTEPVWIGSSAVYNLPARGWIDEFRMWDPQLTEAQIKSYMFTSCRGLPNSVYLCGYNFDGNLINFSSQTGINASLNNGATNTCRFSGYLNDSLTGAFQSSFISHATVINRTGSPNPFPNGFNLAYPFIAIPDNNLTGISDSINISSAVNVTSVEVFLSIEHTYIGDLTILLRSPNNSTKYLVNQHGGGADNILSFFSDNFTNVVNSSTYLPPWGFVKPFNAFGNFNNAPVNGVWKITCADVVGGDAGVLEGWGIRFNNFVSSENISANTPVKFNLYQNYPNPFNPSTNIKFDLPFESNVKIKIFDILGREVFLLANGEFKAGTHSITYDASNLSSGTYFFTIIAESKNKTGSFIDTKKMVLIK